MEKSRGLSENMFPKTDVCDNVIFGTVDFDFDTIMSEFETGPPPEEKNILAKFPYNSLVSLGWIEATKDEFLQILNLRHFFCVDSLQEINLKQQVAFRQSKAKNIDPYALAAWLRKGEILSMDIELPTFCKNKLENAIPQLRRIAYEIPNDFFDCLVDILHETGVGLIAVKNPKNTAVNGAVRKIYGKPIIQMSIYKLRLDILLFSLFHEIGHILLHDIDKQDFISLEKTQKNTTDIEADDFATETLLKNHIFNEFAAKRNFSLPAINKFSKQVLVHPSIVMGRLEHEKKVSYNRYAKHYGKLTFVKNN